MKILILGGTGVMGQALIPLLATRDNVKIYVTSRNDRKSDQKNVYYITGDAHKESFLENILHVTYDVIIDFMIYTTEEFMQRKDTLLKSTKQYIFFSSSRVYANSSEPITEKSLRLVDACNDKQYLSTDEYALAKGRQENALLSSKKENWTIIRPYITYGDIRLQLGTYEKELWLYRALHGRTIIFPEDIASAKTTLTMAQDVAEGIAAVINNFKAFGNIFQITTNESMSWKEILTIYQDVFKNVTGTDMKVKWVNKAEDIRALELCKYQVKYDRLFDRIFDNRNIQGLINGRIKFTLMKDGLESCMEQFIKEPKFLKIPWQQQAYMDRETKERALPSEFTSFVQWIEYLFLRYMPQKIVDCVSKMHIGIKKRMKLFN